MRNSIATLSLVAALAVLPASAFGAGEIFKLELSGIERCADFDAFKFGSRNNMDLWLKIVDVQEWDISFTSDFAVDQVIPIIGVTYLAKGSKMVFSGAQFVGDAFIAIEGTASLENDGVTVRRATGTFNQQIFIQLLNDPNNPNPICFSSGKFTTTQRLPQ
ncbi:MAG TPA: hypothetical protein VKF60_16520 [Myxococcota bacterium]|nr:hypothetical protein [Myxococcota bacterium]